MQILVVDDEKNIRRTLREILQDAGHEVHTAPDGEKALAELDQWLPEVVLLDVKLPGMDGMEVLARLRLLAPQVSVVMISGHGDIAMAVQAVRGGAYDFLEKPLSLSRVNITLENLQKHRELNMQYRENRAAMAAGYRMIGVSQPFRELQELIRRVSRTDAKVLIRGESGSGKELVAFAIHHGSSRAGGPFVKFNSAALPRELVESELFGYEKGAFTGARERRTGKIEAAHGGTLFLDEIGDMDLAAQAKVLRVLQDGVIERVGGTRAVKVDVRILAATNKDLESLMEQGRFRADLYYRLNVFPIRVPPLRDRPEDVKPLVDYFLDQFAAEMKQPRLQLEPRALKLLQQYTFPGNIRELRNLVERLCILTTGTEITAEHVEGQLAVSRTPRNERFPFLELQEFSRARRQYETYYLQKHLGRFHGNISRLAEALGMKQPNLSRKLKDLGIRRRET